jgi:hypothetical protein
VHTQALCPNVIPDAFRGVSSNLGLLSLCVTEEQRKRGKASLAEQTEADADVSTRISVATQTDWANAARIETFLCVCLTSAVMLLLACSRWRLRRS